MLQWLTANAGTIIICLVLALIVTGIIISVIKDKKKGRQTCGNNCAHCALSGKCHFQQHN